jgi:N-acetylneuraminate synthase
MRDLPKDFFIAQRPVGRGAPCFVIGEIAQAHDGSLGTAHAYIDAVARAGADAIKFQTHIASEESTPHEPWRVRFSTQDATRYDYWKRMEFTRAQWGELKAHCDDAGLVFLSTPFSPLAVEWLLGVDIPAWKIASGEINNHELIEACTRTGLPILLSSGMSSYRELDDAVARITRSESPLALFQCSTQYPCPAEEVGLNVLRELQERYACPTGLSDHSGEIFPSLAAVALGAKFVEVHVTFDKQMFGPDVPASLTLSQLTSAIEGIRFTERMLESPVDKDAKAKELEPLRRVFNKSVVLKEALPAGTVLAREQLAAKKPGTGIPAREIDRVAGRKLLRDCPSDHLLSEDDLGDA